MNIPSPSRIWFTFNHLVKVDCMNAKAGHGPAVAAHLMVADKTKPNIWHQYSPETTTVAAVTVEAADNSLRELDTNHPGATAPITKIPVEGDAPNFATTSLAPETDLSEHFTHRYGSQCHACPLSKNNSTVQSGFTRSQCPWKSESVAWGRTVRIVELIIKEVELLPVVDNLFICSRHRVLFG